MASGGHSQIRGLSWTGNGPVPAEVIASWGSVVSMNSGGGCGIGHASFSGITSGSPSLLLSGEPPRHRPAHCSMLKELPWLIVVIRSARSGEPARRWGPKASSTMPASKPLHVTGKTTVSIATVPPGVS